MAEWQKIETAPKDGTPIWAYLYDTGIRLMRWMGPIECAIYEGSASPDDYDGVWVEVDDEGEDWEPLWWLPVDALPPKPARP